MNNIIKNLIFLSLFCFIPFSIQAKDELVLEIVNECNIQYAGDSCIAELRLTNNTNEILDGEAFLGVDYQGICGNGSFDGEGIEAQFSIIDNNWLNFSGWENGTTTVSGFEIPEGETFTAVEIKTHPALMPGQYSFIFSLKGIAEEEYVAPPIVIGGGGYYVPPTSYEIGDTNRDDKVDKYDFLLMMANWEKTGTNDSDLNNDNKVDKYDFALLMLNWSAI